MEDQTATTPASEALRDLGERYFQTQHTYDPYNATLLGLHEFDQLAGDPSREASEAAADEFVRIAADVAAIDTATLSETDSVDHGVLTVLTRAAERDARDSLWAANASAKSYVSRQGLIFQTVPAMTMTDANGADATWTASLASVKACAPWGTDTLSRPGKGEHPPRSALTTPLANSMAILRSSWSRMLC